MFSVYAEIAVLHHLLSDAPMKKEQHIISEKKETQQYISPTVKHMLAANKDFGN